MSLTSSTLNGKEAGWRSWTGKRWSSWPIAPTPTIPSKMTKSMTWPIKVWSSEIAQMVTVTLTWKAWCPKTDDGVPVIFSRVCSGWWLLPLQIHLWCWFWNHTTCILAKSPWILIERNRFSHHTKIQYGLPIPSVISKRYENHFCLVTIATRTLASGETSTISDGPWSFGLICLLPSTINSPSLYQGPNSQISVPRA